MNKASCQINQQRKNKQGPNFIITILDSRSQLESMILQGALADIFLRGSNLMAGARGMASLVCISLLLFFSFILFFIMYFSLSLLKLLIFISICPIPVINWRFICKM